MDKSDRTKYTTIQLPADFVEAYIDPVIRVIKLGFSSRAEVVKAGVRQLFEKFKSEGSL